MKKICFLFLLLLTACDSKTGLEHIEQRFPDSTIKNVPGHSYEWIVKDSEGNIWFVQDYGCNETCHTPCHLMFKAEKK